MGIKDVDPALLRDYGQAAQELIRLTDELQANIRSVNLKDPNDEAIDAAQASAEATLGALTTFVATSEALRTEVDSTTAKTD